MFLVRRMTGADLEKAFSVINLNLDEYFAPEVIEFFLMQWPEGQLVAETLTGQFTGVLCGARLDQGRASVSLLAVDSAFRGMGAGSSLLDGLRRCCLMEGIRTIQLEVRTSNADAIRFYQKRGFTVTERLPCFYNDGGDGFRMASRLGPS